MPAGNEEWLTVIERIERRVEANESGTLKDLLEQVFDFDVDEHIIPAAAIFAGGRERDLSDDEAKSAMHSFAFGLLLGYEWAIRKDYPE